MVSFAGVSLTPREVFAFRGRLVDGLSTRELARRAGLRTTNAIRMRCLRARRRMAASGDRRVQDLAKQLVCTGVRRRPTYSLLPSDA